jgi:hypothetical protein
LSSNCPSDDIVQALKCLPPPADQIGANEKHPLLNLPYTGKIATKDEVKDANNRNKVALMAKAVGE